MPKKTVRKKKQKLEIVVASVAVLQHGEKFVALDQIDGNGRYTSYMRLISADYQGKNAVSLGSNQAVFISADTKILKIV